MKTELTKELYESPIKARNIERDGEHGDMCECCGKRLKNSDNLYVHMNEKWMAVNPEYVKFKATL
jgi:hypothetical protein